VETFNFKSEISVSVNVISELSMTMVMASRLGSDSDGDQYFVDNGLNLYMVNNGAGGYEEYHISGNPALISVMSKISMAINMVSEIELEHNYEQYFTDLEPYMVNDNIGGYEEYHVGV
jgi:hypothetical protein